MKNKLSNYSFNIAIILSFLGFYILLLLLENLSLIAISRQFSIPFRVIICLLFIFGWLNSRTKHFPNYLVLFALYCSFLIIRIWFDIISNRYYYLEYTSVFLFLFSFCIIPFFCIAASKNSIGFYTKLNKLLIWSAFLFSIIATLGLRKFIGSVARLNSTVVGEEVISPLILSYCSTLCIAISVSYLLKTKPNRNRLYFVLSICTIIFSIVPFFLGASRGSLVALFVSILFYIFSKYGVRSIYYSLFAILLISLPIYYLDSYLESGLLERFFGTKEGIDSGSDSATRINIWKSSLQQFIEHPLFGDKMQMDYSFHHPHNFFIESLQMVGFIGTLPLFILLIYSFRTCVFAFKYYKDLLWVPFFFIQSIIQFSFSGTIFTAAWLWTSMAILLSLNKLKIHKDD